MPQTTCCVPGCSKRGGHRWPKDQEQSRKWMHAVRRERWTPTEHTVVCHGHFSPDDYIEQNSNGDIPERRLLKPDVVPSVFWWSKTATPETEQRAERASKRLKRWDEREFEAPEVGTEVVITTEDDSQSEAEPDNSPNETEKIPVTTSTQTPHSPPYNIENYTHNDDAVHHLTGLETYNRFMFVLNTLGPAAYDLNYRWRNCQLLSVPNQFFLTMIKLRQYNSNKDLSLMFDISEFSVANIFITWINFMHDQWREIDIWPTKSMVSYFMPADFAKKFPTTRIILDGMECPIKKPKCPLTQQATYSTYKNRNTAKAVVGMSPGGLFTYIPPAYGGSTSDRQFVERSNLMTSCDKGDSIMVDKGMNVQDLFAPSDVLVNIPTFLKKGNQFNAKALSHDRKVASKRVHIERLIGLAKTYKILTRPMCPTECSLASEIIFICCMLCNFRTCIVPSDA